MPSVVRTRAVHAHKLTRLISLLRLALVAIAAVPGCNDDTPALISTVGYVETPIGVSTPIAIVRTLSRRNVRIDPATVTWSSSDASVATVERNASGSTYVLARAAGSATLTARLDEGEVRVPVVVTTAQAVGVSVAVENGIPKGLARELRVTATYDDGSRYPAETSTELVSSETTVAVVTESELQGETRTSLAAIEPGVTTLTATMEGLAPAALEVEVTDDPLTWISIEFGATEVPPNAPLQFRALGVCASGTVVEATEMVTWSIEGEGVATLDPWSPGMVVASGAGTFELVARLGDVEARTTLTVLTEAPDEIRFEKVGVQHPEVLGEGEPVPSIAVGHSLAVDALAYYGETNVHVTNAVVWSTSDPTVASVGNGIHDRGVVRARRPGTVTLTATLGSLTHATELVVSDAELVSIRYQVVWGSEIALGSSTFYSAVGTFSDGTELFVNDLVTFASSGPCVRVDALPYGAVVVAREAGRCTVSAVLGAFSVAHEVRVHRFGTVLVAEQPSSLLVGDSTQLHASGVEGIMTFVDVTEAATWSTSDATVATVSNDPGTRGLVTTHAPGTVTITFAYDDPSTTGTNDDGVQSASVPLTVD